MERIIETWGKSIFKDEIGSASEVFSPVFSMFSEILRFLNFEENFTYSGNAFQRVFHPASRNGFSV